jgi:uncharacterized small protein (TIGR04563 family)
MVTETLYFPDALIEEIGQRANRLDTTFERCIERAWRLARSEIGAIKGSFHEGAEAIYEARYGSNDGQRAQTVTLSDTTFAEIRREATRIDRSWSWTVARAWCLALERFDAELFDANDAEK